MGGEIHEARLAGDESSLRPTMNPWDFNIQFYVHIGLNVSIMKELSKQKESEREGERKVKDEREGGKRERKTRPMPHRSLSVPTIAVCFLDRKELPRPPRQSGCQGLGLVDIVCCLHICISKEECPQQTSVPLSPRGLLTSPLPP